jgi:hypothetical protein
MNRLRIKLLVTLVLSQSRRPLCAREKGRKQTLGWFYLVFKGLQHAGVRNC